MDTCSGLRDATLSERFVPPQLVLDRRAHQGSGGARRPAARWLCTHGSYGVALEFSWTFALTAVRDEHLADSSFSVSFE